MGTSLSGLTPATTFDGLLKVGDNDPLTADLKAISTGDGTDTILQLSNSDLSIGGATTIIGNGTDKTTKEVHVQNSNSDDILNLTDGALATLGATGKQGEINLKRPQDGLAIGKIQGTNNGLYLTNQDASNHILIGNSSTRGVSVGNGSASAMGARFGIKGSGASAGTTSLLVQNSAGTDMLKVTDNGAIDFGVLGLDFSNDGSGGTMSVASDRYIKLASSLSTYSALSAHLFKTFDGSAYSEAMRITGNTDQFVGIGETTPTARLHVKGSGNDSTTTSLLVQNSDGADMMVLDDSKEVSFKGRAGFYNGVFIVENNHTKTQGNAIFGAFATPTARLQVKGSGATSATTALLVQNSVGDEMVKVTVDGVAIFNSFG